MSIDFKKYITQLTGVGENKEIEFKSAKGGFPHSFWETYSSFANSDGGVIVLGIGEKKGNYIVDGLDKSVASKYLNDLWLNVNNRSTVSRNILRDDDVDLKDIDGRYFLVIRVPRARFDQRPVYCSPNPFGNTYRRCHEGDYVCPDEEVRRMFADADHVRHPQDGRIMRGYKFDRDIDMTSLRGYRNVMLNLQPTHPWNELDDLEFFRKIGGYTTDIETGEEGITVAGLLMFGKYEAITNTAGFPNFFPDYREFLHAEDPGTRWTDRIYPNGLWEANLYQFYVKVYNKLIQQLPRPFVLKGDERQEETSAHDAVREALINCIVHFDINAPGNIIVEQTDEELKFSNPGILLMSVEQFFNGGRSICRNPHLQNMFIHLSRSEKAGSGVDKILKGWRELGWASPMVQEDSQPDYVVLTLPIGPSNDTETDTENTGSGQKGEAKVPQSSPKFPKVPQSSPEFPVHLTKCLNTIRRNPEVSLETLSKELDVSTRMVKKYIQKMKELGVIVREGSNRNGRWRIVE